MMYIVLFLMVLGTHADTGSPYEDAKNKCPTNSEEMKILQELLGQETTLRGLKVSFQNVTEDISMLSKMKDLLFINDGERKRDISSNRQQIEQLVQIFNRSATNVKIMEKNFLFRIDGLEKSLKALEKTVLNLENDTQTSDNQPMFCPANTVDDTGLVQSGYAMIDCSDIHRKYPEGKSGTYRIYPAGGAGYTAFCDMVTDGGGWTVFQRREDGSVDFYRNWKEYKDGFGTVTGEHWLGNRAISELSCHCPVCELRIDLEDFEGNRRYAKYSNFSLGKEEDGFTLKLGSYIGDAGDPFTAIHKGQKFTTKDRDQDKTKIDVNCAIKYQGAWWFENCYRAHLNGQFFDGGKQNKSWTGIIWDTWKGAPTKNVTDCSDIHQRYPELRSGSYRIYPTGGAGFIAYCDMETDGGGWTVFQRRKDGRVDFYRGWDDYRKGFGDVNGEHWLGNVALSELSVNCRHCKLRIDLEDFEGNRRYAKYSDFSVSGETTGFVLKLGNYSGNAGNSMTSSGIHNHNGQKFSTNDKDQDRSGNNCANVYLGAWWFNSCFGAHLNGQYFDSHTTNKTWHGIIWKTWRGKDYSLKATKMMLREQI